MELICEDLCELVGIIIGDGCITNSSKNYTIEIAGSPKEEDYIKNHAYNLLNKFSDEQKEEKYILYFLDILEKNGDNSEVLNRS